MISNSLKELKENQKALERETALSIENFQKLKDKEIAEVEVAFTEICKQLIEYNEFLEREFLSIHNKLFAYWGDPGDSAYDRNAFLAFNTHPYSGWHGNEVGDVIKIENYGYNGLTTIIISNDGNIKAKGYNLEKTKIAIVRDWPVIKILIETKIEELLKHKISAAIESSNNIQKQVELLHEINMKNTTSCARSDCDINERDYVGKEIQLYPGDSDAKFGIIKKVDKLGWTIEITKSNDPTLYKTGTTHFISHAKKFSFRFVDKIKGNSLKPVLV